jgi:EpsG family
LIYKNDIHPYKADLTSQRQKFFQAVNIPYTALVFFIWPFLSLLIAIFNFSNKKLRVFILWFFVLFGATGVIDETKTHDAFAHSQTFKDVATKPFSELGKIVSDLFSGNTTSVTDLYATLVNFFISRFTDNPAFMFAFHALVFGFFYIKTISLLFDEFPGVKNINAILFLILFIFIIPIDKVQYVRFWTAAWIFIYALLKLLKKKQLKYFILMSLSALVHASFVLPLAIAFIYLAAGNRTNIYFGILILSYVAPYILKDQIEQIGSLGAGDVIDNKVSAYALNEEYIAQRNTRFETRSWYIEYQSPALHYCLLFVLAYIRIKKEKYLRDKYQISLFSFLILFLAFVNFGSEIASVGERFILLFFCFALVYLFRHFSLNYNNTGKIHWLTYVMIIPGMLWIVVQLRLMLDFMNAFMLFGNPFFFLFEGTNITLLN